MLQGSNSSFLATSAFSFFTSANFILLKLHLVTLFKEFNSIYLRALFRYIRSTNTLSVSIRFIKISHLLYLLRAFSILSLNFVNVKPQHCSESVLEGVTTPELQSKVILFWYFSSTLFRFLSIGLRIDSKEDSFRGVTKAEEVAAICFPYLFF